MGHIQFIGILILVIIILLILIGTLLKKLDKRDVQIIRKDRIISNLRARIEEDSFLNIQTSVESLLKNNNLL